MRIGCLLDNAIKARSVTKGSGTNDESMKADNNRPGPPSAGSVDFSHNLNCAQSTAITPLEQLLVGACVIMQVTASHPICETHTLATFPSPRSLSGGSCTS